MTTKLSFRLSKALSFVPAGTNVIDVGADRGQFSVALAQLGHSVLAIENKKGPFLSLSKTIEESGLSNLSCKLADGIDYLPSDINCCCILGMGGKTIYEILSRHLDRLTQFGSIIIEPQSCPEMAIQLLLEQGFINDLGCYVYEKKYYPLLRFIPSNQNRKYTSADILYGPYNVENRDSVLLEFLEKQIQVYSKIDTESAHVKRAEYELQRKEIFGI